MKNDHYQIKHPRGSSPPFQETDQSVHEGFTIKDQHAVNGSEHRAGKQSRYKKEKYNHNQLDAFALDTREFEQPPPAMTPPQLDEESHARWQDDGGEGG